MKRAEVQAFYDEPTATLTYVVWDPYSRDAVVIDPIVDYDPATQMTSRKSIEKLLHFVREKDLQPHWVIDTHVHADHLTGAREICSAVNGCRWAMNEKMGEVFRTFKKVYSWTSSDLDVGEVRWLKDGEEISAGTMRVQAIFTPGHTPACTTFKIDEMLFTGDALMMPDSGVGRCDFPGGNAGQLYDSVWGRLYSFPDHYQVYVGHDYKPGGRALAYQSSLQDQKENNIHLKLGTSRAEFIAFREGRDKTLAAPRLLQPSLDWNLGAHQLVKRISP